jgi:hypothetical protein
MAVFFLNSGGWFCITNNWFRCTVEVPLHLVASSFLYLERYRYIRFCKTCTMIVFSPIVSNRLKYIVEFTMGELTGQPVILTSDAAAFIACEGPAINYSPAKLREVELRITPHTLLFETGIHHQETEISYWHQQPVFFQGDGDIPFDIFAASFYLLSRYEEYLPHTKDLYGRYPHTESLAFKNGFLDKPLVNEWLKLFTGLLKERFTEFIPKEQVFTFLPTYDIDEAFSFRNKGLVRNTGGFLRDLFNGNLDRCMLRIQLLTGRKHDPYDSFDHLHRLHEQYNLDPLYFFLLASRIGQYDKNTDPSGKAMQTLIRAHAAKYRTGIHPSWQSGDDSTLLKKEIDLLEKVTNKPVTVSRQHYLRFNLPGGYHRLLQAGILEDHSMGYGMVNGFRASVAAPFYWYDLENETITDLRLFPFCYMEANSFYELKQSPEEALEEMRHYYTSVKNVNGLLITLWHNTFLGDSPAFKGWKEVYQEFLKLVTNR